MTARRERILRGVSVSHGFARGPVHLHRSVLPEPDERVLASGQVKAELVRFRAAVAATRDELSGLAERVRKEMGRDFAEFFEVQLALLGDGDVLASTERFIAEKGRNAEFAYLETLKSLTRPMAGSGVALFQERMLDVIDVGRRVLGRLGGDAPESLHSVAPGSIVVAHDLPPSEAALLNPELVRGLVLESGGRTSHTAIMAKAKEIPAVVGVEMACQAASTGQPAIVDGYRGLAVLNPSRQRTRAYEGEMARYERYRRSLTAVTGEEPVTTDGRFIDLSANIEFLAEARSALKYGARGIGLFRTEYIFLARMRPPTEEEQYEVLAEVVRLLNPLPVIVRTFDLGGDKLIPGYSESNPFLGWRGLRLCFDNPEMLRTQLRAILRASAHGTVKVMFPMVSVLEELRRALLMVEAVKQELKRDGRRFDPGVEVGVMVETPSAALLAGELARHCSFLSIGSNDLTQYTLAVDRGNERVAGLYDHFHPAILQLVKHSIDAAHRHGIWVGLCGEFASDPLGIVVLLGMGIDELSVTPALLPEAKNIIRSIDTRAAAEVAESVLKLATAVEVRRLLNREVHRRFPQLARFMFKPENGPGKDEGEQRDNGEGADVD